MSSSSQPPFQFLRKTFLFRPLRALNHWYIIRRWQMNGRPVPPPALFKQKLVREYGRKYSLQILVETGTAQGKMIQASHDHFQHIISIEYDPELYQQAKQQFAPNRNITLLQGDSGERLAEIMVDLNEPALFWLDAHAMIGGIRPPQLTPIVQELHHILEHPVTTHIILIDDARLFTEKSGYPSIEAVQSLINKYRPARLFVVKDDVIRICPA